MQVLKKDIMTATGLSLSLIQEIIDFIVGRISVQTIIFYGSRVKNQYTECSDIDIAVNAPIDTVLPAVELNEDINTLLSIDLVNLNKVPDHLKQEILQEGMVVYEKT